MSPLSREDLMELGASLPTDLLVDWAARQLAATAGKEARLESRGVNAAYLAGLKDLIATIGQRPEETQEPALQARRIFEEASGYWREAKQIARAGFGTCPDLLAKFRTGVQTGLLLANLGKELGSMVALLREHSSQLAGLGATEAFIGRGARLIGKLKEAKAGLDAACRALPAPAAQRHHDKGLLYDLARRLVRIGRLEFILEPEQAAAFSFTGARGPSGAPPSPGGGNGRSKASHPHARG